MALMMEEKYDDLADLRERAKAEVSKVVIGQDRTVELLLIAAVAHGHVNAQRTFHPLGLERTGRRVRRGIVPPEPDGVIVAIVRVALPVPRQSDDVRRFLEAAVA